MPFRRNDPEHPDINYRHMPLRGLHELTRMVGHVRDCLPDVRCPALILQATEDHVVDPRSAQHVYEHIGSRDKTLHWIASRRHGIVHGDIGDTHARIVEFAQRL
jgi:esterase/lipase